MGGASRPNTEFRDDPGFRGLPAGCEPALAPWGKAFRLLLLYLPVGFDPEVAWFWFRCQILVHGVEGVQNLLQAGETSALGPVWVRIGLFRQGSGGRPLAAGREFRRLGSRKGWQVHHGRKIIFCRLARFRGFWAGAAAGVGGPRSPLRGRPRMPLDFWQAGIRWPHGFISFGWLWAALDHGKNSFRESGIMYISMYFRI